MMRNIYAVSDNIISSLGFTSRENGAAMLAGETGIRIHHDEQRYIHPLPLSLVNTGELNSRFQAVLDITKNDKPADYFTRLEKMLILSVHDALNGISLKINDPQLILILSTTKGNIDLLEEKFKGRFDHKRVYLWAVAYVLKEFFGFINTPMIISNACVSGVLALITASRMLRYGKYTNAIITGGDIISEFVISGFQSFQALSPSACKPFDQNRNGLSLGEGCGTVILSSNQPDSGYNTVKIMGGSVTNDANHISGPSRTGKELSMAINKALLESGTEPAKVDFISAHGTATVFNDEMESKAIALSKLGDTPANSFKGYWGHTLGAAGLMESVALMTSMKRNILFRTAGLDVTGIMEKINVIKETTSSPVDSCVKTASGFGGCNTALVFQKT
jgi:3-oxoacyl-[acyl-carrier-protein] synthase-1